MHTACSSADLPSDGYERWIDELFSILARNDFIEIQRGALEASNNYDQVDQNNWHSFRRT